LEALCFSLPCHYLPTEHIDENQPHSFCEHKDAQSFAHGLLLVLGWVDS
jgi:hypothetical protein